jgi:hypothetical protein
MSISDNRTGLVIFRNNIFQVSNGADIVRSGQWNAGQLVHTNNIYKLSNNSILNFTPNQTEKMVTTAIWLDTSGIPIDWNYALANNSPAIESGIDVGLTRDFANNPIYQNPEIGIYEYYTIVTVPACSFSYGSWSICNNGYQTRTYKVNQIGCQGNPPQDSIRRACINPIVTSFYYNSNRKAIWISTTRSGVMTITNVVGGTTRNINYVAGGQWISLSRYAIGIYFASTYGRSITLLR